MAYIRRTANVKSLPSNRVLRGAAVTPDYDLAVAIVDDNKVHPNDTVITEAEYTTDLATISAAWDALPTPPPSPPPSQLEFQSIKSDFQTWKTADNNWAAMTAGEKADHLRQHALLTNQALIWVFKYVRSLDLSE